MRYVELGEIRTSALGFGCGGVMGRVGRGDSLRAMAAAWEGGVRLFDTARSYGYGEAEGVLGEFLAGRRDEATVVTKFGILPSKPAVWKRLAKPVVRAGLQLLPSARGMVRRQIAGEMSAGHFDVATLRGSLEKSLRELRTEYVDVLLMHEAPSSVMGQEDLLAELAKVVSEGKARRFGVSSSTLIVHQIRSQNSPELTAFQFPANFYNRGFSPARRLGDTGTFFMGNHPFGGLQRSEKARAAITEMAKDGRVKATLREKLSGDSKERLAEVVFGEIFGPLKIDAVVPSMLHLDNLRANLAAMHGSGFSAVELKAVRKRVIAPD